MRHEIFPETADAYGQETADAYGPDTAGATPADTALQLAMLSGEIDQNFMPAGETLAGLVETVGTVLGGLEGIGRALGEDGADANAGRNLLAAAHTLSAAPARQAQRGVQVAGMLATTERLSAAAGEILRLLRILRFYTVNLKIAAAGADEFVEFASDMNIKLDEGTRQVDAFTKQVAAMLTSLGEMRAVDDVLARECARVVPAVPDRLGREVERLQAWQATLAKVSGAARAIVMRLQGGVGKALEAIQIGDITRQRLEHVAQGCERLDDVLATGVADAVGTRAHMLRLLAAQLDDLTGDFSGQGRALLAALGGLAPDCDALLGQRQGGLGDSSAFLRELDACISGAQGMTGQLRRADAKAAEISDVVVKAAEVLRDRVAVIERLRFDVDYMAINVNIQARRDARIGRPVSVIANEIRICSRQMAGLAQEIAAMADELGQVSRAFEADLAADETSVDEALAAALATVRDGAHQATAAMTALDTGARDVVGTIRATVTDLAICDQLSAQLHAMTQAMAAQAGQAAPAIPADGAHPLVALMQGLGASYTMASERQIHDRFLLPGMAQLASSSSGAGSSFGDDDDGFGDVFL